MKKLLLLPLLLLGGCKNFDNNPKSIACYTMDASGAPDQVIYSGVTTRIVVSTIKDNTPFMTFYITEKGDQILYNGHWVSLDVGQQVIVNLNENVCGVK